jgi:hypothetical protein
VGPALRRPPFFCQLGTAEDIIVERVSPMRDQAEDVIRIVEAEAAFQERVNAEASRTATVLIQDYLGPDYIKYSIGSVFIRRFRKALWQAREQGQVDRRGDVLSL